jgi:hypothetical protein
LPDTVTAPRWMMYGFWLFWPVKYAFNFRVILSSQEPIVLSCVPPDAGPAQPSDGAPRGHRLAVVGAAVGRRRRWPTPGDALGVQVISSVSALPLSVSSDRQAPAYWRAWLVAGRPCQWVRVSVPGWAVPELSRLIAWVYGGGAPVVVMVAEDVVAPESR